MTACQSLTDGTNLDFLAAKRKQNSYEQNYRY